PAPWHRAVVARPIARRDARPIVGVGTGEHRLAHAHGVPDGRAEPLRRPPHAAASLLPLTLREVLDQCRRGAGERGGDDARPVDVVAGIVARADVAEAACRVSLPHVLVHALALSARLALARVIQMTAVPPQTGQHSLVGPLLSHTLPSGQPGHGTRTMSSSKPFVYSIIARPLLRLGVANLAECHSQAASNQLRALVRLGHPFPSPC